MPMPRSSTGTRERILQAAYELFYAKGFARVGVDAVAGKAGLTKRTLYYHFKSKDDLLAAVLEHRGELALERVGRWAASLKGHADAFAAALFRELSRWASKPGWEGAGFTRVAMELADLPATRRGRSRGATRPRSRRGSRGSSRPARCAKAPVRRARSRS